MALRRPDKLIVQPDRQLGLHAPKPSETLQSGRIHTTGCHAVKIETRLTVRCVTAAKQLFQHGGRRT